MKESWKNGEAKELNEKEAAKNEIKRTVIRILWKRRVVKKQKYWGENLTVSRQRNSEGKLNI